MSAADPQSNSLASVLDAIHAIAGSLLGTMVRKGVISIEDALSLLATARADVEVKHGFQSPGAILVRFIYHALLEDFREALPKEPRPQSDRTPDGVVRTIAANDTAVPTLSRNT
jgi:hypothetical protein